MAIKEFTWGDVKDIYIRYYNVWLSGYTFDSIMTADEFKTLCKIVGYDKLKQLADYSDTIDDGDPMALFWDGVRATLSMMLGVNGYSFGWMIDFDKAIDEFNQVVDCDQD